MPSSVRIAFVLLLNLILAAVTVGSLIVATGSEFGWPTVWSVLRLAGVVVAVAVSLLFHVLAIGALRREMRRADHFQARAVEAADALVQMSKLGKEQAETFRKFIEGKGGRLGEIEQQASELQASGVKLEERQAEIKRTVDELIGHVKELRGLAD